MSRRNVGESALKRRPAVTAALLSVVICLGATGWARAQATAKPKPPGIRHIEIVHFSHTDYGFTDHPDVCRELQRRFLDVALDTALATRDRPAEGRFCWTAETTVAVDDWWRVATPERRQQFVEMVHHGQLDVAALAHNQTPTLNAREWDAMLDWLPADVWKQLQPQVAIQNDVNGFPRAGAMRLLDRGVGRLFSGINSDSGGPPMRRPSAFWWKMPDGRRMFVWLSDSYPVGYNYFVPGEWRRGPVPRAADTRYRPPRPGEMLGTDEASVRRAHAYCTQRLRHLEAGGYAYPILLISMTNHWRMDNDLPFPPLADFVATWQRLGLKPSLRLTTVASAMKRLEEEIGGRVPEYAGEWTDWWANGVASGPREVAASRLAKRMMADAESPLWGELGDSGRQTAKAIWQDLCLFDEHTWGSSNSVALPYSLDTQAQYNAKAGYAYRAMARAEWLLSQRVRSKLVAQPEGLYLANPGRLPISGWVRMPATCLRDAYRWLEDPKTGAKRKLYFEPGLRPFTRPGSPAELTVENTAATYPDNCPGMVARFWVEDLQGGTILPLRLRTGDVPDDDPDDASVPKVETDAQGWPTSAVWKGMQRPLFVAGAGDFVSVAAKGFAPRWVARDVWSMGDGPQRDQARREKLEEIAAEPGAKTTVESNPHTIVYTQAFSHPRLRWATRRMEVWKREPRASVTLRLHRTSNEAPEAFFVSFTLPCQGVLPQFSSGGVPFVPYADQLPGTCRDYFGIDGWARYATPGGDWLWVSRDAPLVTLGGQQVLARRRDAPKDTHRVLAMVFNNFWYTNFVGDQHGVMEFSFDLAWHKKLDAPAERARALVAKPLVLIQPSPAEAPVLIRRVYRP